ncbi:hypothetical protein AAG906_019399 [Vitis piasezkii]
MLKLESVQKELQFTEHKLKLVKGQQQRQRKEQKRLLQKPGRANTEACERAAVARAEAEMRLRTERAAVERAAADSRERAAAAARVNQQKNENDLESFFSMGSRPSSAPRPRANSSDPMFDTQFQNRRGPEVARTSASASSTMRKASSTTNIVDDLSSILEENLRKRRLIQDGVLGITWKGLGGVFKVAPCSDGE